MSSHATVSLEIIFCILLYLSFPPKLTNSPNSRYLAQGANTALEDGAVLGYLLGKINQASKETQLPSLGKLYQNLRKERTEMIQREALGQRESFHLEDGPEQQARDILMTGMMNKTIQAGFPSRWTCPKVQSLLYGYDAYFEVEEAFKANPF